jgi:geranylgeranyl diphosphate synthase type I
MNANRLLPEILRRYRSAIADYLRQLLTRDQVGLLSPMLRYQLGFEEASGRPGKGPAGKLVRPALLLASCEAVGGDWQRAIPAAAAIELTHNFSLVHDDIQDRDEKRHGRPSLWSVWGVAQGINTGDALHALADSALLDLAPHGVSPEQILRAQRITSEATLKLIAGQVQDLSFEQRLDVAVAEYLEMIAGKTGALIEASCQLGALLGEANQKTITAFSDFGRHLGLAFQIRDDILGIWGKASHTGKAEAGDLERRKKTLPVVYALERATGTDREVLFHFYDGQTSTEASASVAPIIAIMERLGVDQEAEKLLNVESARALEALGSVSLPAEAQARFKELLDFLFQPEAR